MTPARDPKQRFGLGTWSWNPDVGILVIETGLWDPGSLGGFHFSEPHHAIYDVGSAPNTLPGNNTYLYIVLNTS